MFPDPNWRVWSLGKRSSAPKFMCVFAVGIAVGFAASSLLVSYRIVEKEVFINFKADPNLSSDVALRQCPQAKEESLQSLHYNMDLNSSYTQLLLRKAEEMQARRIAEEVRILCWVMTNPENHKEKAFHVKATWGRHCNKLIFISEKEDPDLPAVKLDVGSGREGLWSKTVAAFKYAHDNHRSEYDWVMKADDDTYVLVENLRSMLLPFSSGEPLYFGFRFKPHTPLGYMSGGAGYVLSKEAVDRLINQAFNDKNDVCRGTSDGGAEDINIALCLHSVGVKPGDSRDSQGRNRFFPFDVESHVNPNQFPKDWWYWDYVYWPIDGGLDCCSDEPISFHYLNTNKMYMLEYLAYHVKPFGVTHLDKAIIPQTPPPTTEKNTT